MENQERQFQRRAMVGNRHFVLANPEHPDIWALAGSEVQSVDKHGVRCFGPAKTISTSELVAWAKANRLPYHIEENFPVCNRDLNETVAA
jgi:hypothetical protein